MSNLIACGHYTTDYNLLTYLTELQRGKTSPYRGTLTTRPDFKALYDVLLEDRKKFKIEPP